MKTNDNIDIGKYILKFAGYYLLAVIVITTITIVLKIDSNSMTMVSVTFATMMTSLKFINENKRVPNSYEKKQLVWYCFTVTWIISLVLVFLFLSISGELGSIIDILSKVGFGLLLTVMLFVSAIEILILYFGYGWLANKQYKDLVKNGKI